MTWCVKKKLSGTVTGSKEPGGTTSWQIWSAPIGHVCRDFKEQPDNLSMALAKPAVFPDRKGNDAPAPPGNAFGAFMPGMMRRTFGAVCLTSELVGVEHAPLQNQLMGLSQAGDECFERKLGARTGSGPKKKKKRRKKRRKKESTIDYAKPKNARVSTYFTLYMDRCD